MKHGTSGVKLIDDCRDCGGDVVTVITHVGQHAWLSDTPGALGDIPFKNRYGVEFRRTIWHAQICQDCRARQNWVAKVMGKPKPVVEVREDIVDAIKRLRAKGWKFPWE